MQFKDVLKELRKEKGLSQTMLAREIDYSVSIISKWENGEREPTAPALISLSEYFDVTVDYLLGRDE